MLKEALLALWAALVSLFDKYGSTVSAGAVGYGAAKATDRIAALEVSAEQTDEAAAIRQDSAALSDAALSDELHGIYEERRKRRRGGNKL